MSLDNVIKELYDNPDLYMPLRSSYITKKRLHHSFGTTMVVPNKIRGAKEVIYGKGKKLPITRLFPKQSRDMISRSEKVYTSIEVLVF